jgi:hypothetical protein
MNYVEGGGSTVGERNNILEGYMEFDLIPVGGIESFWTYGGGGEKCKYIGGGCAGGASEVRRAYME